MLLPPHHHPRSPRRTYPTVNTSQAFAEAVKAAIIYNHARRLNQIGKPTDKTHWYMTAPTVNAYYDPSANQMNFPAGILQPPFFDGSYPPEMNAGGIGMVMGHELTHGFDNQGPLPCRRSRPSTGLSPLPYPSTPFPPFSPLPP